MIFYVSMCSFCINKINIVCVPTKIQLIFREVSFLVFEKYQTLLVIVYYSAVVTGIIPKIELEPNCRKLLTFILV